MLKQQLEEPRLGRFIAGAALVSSALFALVAWLHLAASDLVRRGVTDWWGEVYPGCVALALLGLTALVARRHRDRLQTLLPLACLVAIALALLMALRVAGRPSWDYDCYFRAGQAIRHGANSYQLPGYQYLYSPALATLFSAVNLLPREQQEPVSFFLWQAANYWSALGFVLLLAAALRRYRVEGPFFWPALAAAMLVNVPLQRTLAFSQVNLYVINLLLGYLLLSPRHRLLGGGLLGVAAVLKTSPVLLFLLPLLERRGKALLGAVLGAGAVVAASIAIVGMGPWRDFLPVLLGTRSHGLYRDNSLQSLLLSLGGALGAGGEEAAPLLIGRLLSVAAMLVMIWWASQPRYRRVFADSDDRSAGAFPLLLVAMVIASPLIWEHHWVFLQLPFCLLVARAWRTRLAIPALLSYALVFAVPTFDVFPLSYHRLAGLIWWAALVQGMAKQGSAQTVILSRSQRV